MICKYAVNVEFVQTLKIVKDFASKPRLINLP